MKEVILLGAGPSGTSCPYDAEVWCTATTLPYIKGEVSKVFAWDAYGRVKKGIDLAVKMGLPIVSAGYPYVTEEFPYNEIVKEFKTAYFKNTASYMIAYAIYKKYEKIRLYGIDQGPEWLYLIHKPYVTFWLGVASGRGIEWEITKKSLLFRAMKENLRKKYKELAGKQDYVSMARADRDPYCFVDGIDPSAITVESNYGGETIKWHYQENDPNYVAKRGENVPEKRLEEYREYERTR